MLLVPLIWLPSQSGYCKVLWKHTLYAATTCHDAAPYGGTAWLKNRNTRESHTRPREFSRRGRTWFLQIRKWDRRCESRCADSTTRVVHYINAVAKLDRTSMKKLVSKREKHCKTWLARNRGCNFVSENESRCAEFTTRGRKNKVQVAKVARTSKKICGPTRRDGCKNHGETKIGDHL